MSGGNFISKKAPTKLAGLKVNPLLCSASNLNHNNTTTIPQDGQHCKQDQAAASLGGKHA